MSDSSLFTSFVVQMSSHDPTGQSDSSQSRFSSDRDHFHAAQTWFFTRRLKSERIVGQPKDRRPLREQPPVGAGLIAASVQWAEAIMRKIDKVFSG